MRPVATPSPAVREAPRAKTRRVYKTVAVSEHNGAFKILLDTKPVMTPLRAPLATIHRALADAVAAEWDAQNPYIDPETMPLTRLLSTAIDRVVPARAAMIGELMNYAEADLLCYRAEFPASLRERQHAVWQPVLDWLASVHGVALQVHTGLMPRPQAGAAIAALRAKIEALDDSRLTAMQAAAAIVGSLALALALVHGQLTAADTFAAAVLDESFQMERWGSDELALARRRLIERDVRTIGDYLSLIGLP